MLLLPIIVILTSKRANCQLAHSNSTVLLILLILIISSEPPKTKSNQSPTHTHNTIMMKLLSFFLLLAVLFSADAAKFSRLRGEDSVNNNYLGSINELVISAWA